MSHDDIARNERVSSDRALVENYLGRLSSLSKISSATFKWSEEKYDQVCRLTFALTNFHVKLMPLRRDDATSYRDIISRYRAMSHDNSAKKAHAQRMFRAKQATRLQYGRSHPYSTPSRNAVAITLSPSSATSQQNLS